MHIIRGLHNLRDNHRGCVATIGNFDGVHLGHHAVVSELAEIAAERNLPSLLILFEPQPQEYFAPQAAPARLTRLREKLVALRDTRIDRVLVVKFSKSFAALSASEFIQKVLIDGLAIQHLVVGDDFRFGKDRLGDFNLLETAGKSAGFSVAGVSTFTVEDKRVSSTRVREALAQGDVELAAKLLGRSYRMGGRVVRGNQRGRTIGFPTANLMMHRQVSPVAGVFAVRMHGLQGNPLAGVANIGSRPTVDGNPQFLLETHIFDFDADIYGKAVEVELCQRLRDERKFESFEQLREQILLDAQAAREFFG